MTRKTALAMLTSSQKTSWKIGRKDTLLLGSGATGRDSGGCGGQPPSGELSIARGRSESKSDEGSDHAVEAAAQPGRPGSVRCPRAPCPRLSISCTRRAEPDGD